MSETQAPVKIKIRGDVENNLITAWFSMTDGSDEFVASTLCMRLADDDRQAYEDWKDALIAIHTRWLEKLTGMKVKRVDSFPPHESN